MKLQVHITIDSDDGNVTRESNNGLVLATDLPGVDSATAKQDFLTQADNLMRVISDGQLPALYDAVINRLDELRDANPGEDEPTAAQAAVRAAIEARRAKQLGQFDAGTEEGV